MKKVIDNKLYNTETAQKVAEDCNGYNPSDFQYEHEELYITKKGSYFLYGTGGALSAYSESNGRNHWGIETIISLSDDDAYQWLVKKGFAEEIEKYFSDRIQEA